MPYLMIKVLTTRAKENHGKYINLSLNINKQINEGEGSDKLKIREKQNHKIVNPVQVPRITYCLQ